MNQPLAPLANLYAFGSLDPEVVEEVAADLEVSGRFAEVWRPHPQWVVGTAPLPHGEPDGAAVRDGGFAFAEGRHRAIGRGKDPAPGLARLARLIDGGGAQLAGLDGDFGFIRFHPDGSATVVRSAGGLVPVYVWSGSRAVAIATLLTDHARYLPGEVSIDPLVHATWTTLWGRSPDNRTFLADVQLLPRGHLATVSASGSNRWSQYWDPRHDRVFEPSPAQTKEHQERLRAALVDHLSESLHPDGGNLLSLSGGVDSSSLAALAVRVVGRPIGTVSFVAPDDDPGRADELSFIEPLLDELGVIQRTFRPHAVHLLHEGVGKGPEAVVHVHHPVLCHLPEMVRETGVRVLFGGEFADETCGSSFTIPDWDASTSALSLVRGYPQGFGSWKYPGRWARSRLRNLAGRSPIPFPDELPDMIRQDLHPEYVEWRARQQRDYVRDRRPWRYMAIRLHVGQSWTEMNWEAASLLGVRRVIPFVTREVLELAFSCHPSELIGPGRSTKRLIRGALADDVPARNLFRKDKGVYDSPEVSAPLPWTEALPDELGLVLRAEWVPTPPEQLGPVDCLRLKQVLHSVSALRRLRGEREQRKISP